jgi:hypothetical protein
MRPAVRAASQPPLWRVPRVPLVRPGSQPPACSALCTTHRPLQTLLGEAVHGGTDVMRAGMSPSHCMQGRHLGDSTVVLNVQYTDQVLLMKAMYSQ